MPVIITPSKTVHRFGDVPPQYRANANPYIRPHQWSVNPADGGGFSLGQTLQDQWTVYSPARNQTRAHTISVDSGGGQVASSLLQVYGTFPLHPVYPFDSEVDQHTEYSQSEDLSPESEFSRERGGEIITFNYSREDASLALYNTLITFWRWHRKVLWFYYVDAAHDELLFVRFDSGIHRRTNMYNRLTLTCVLRGKFVGIAPAVPEGGVPLLSGGGDALSPSRPER